MPTMQKDTVALTGDRQRSDSVVVLSELPESVSEVLRPLDMNGDGHVSTTELACAAGLLASQKKTVRRQNFWLAAAGVIMALLVGANFASSVLAVELGNNLRLPTQGSASIWGMGAPHTLVSRSDSGPVLTGALAHNIDLMALPSYGPSPLPAVKFVSLHETGGEVRGFQVEGFLWHNASALTLFLSQEYTLFITPNNLDLAGHSTHVADTQPGRQLRHRRLDWCVCCCTFSSGHATTTVSNTGVGTANVGAGNGNSASIASGNTANVGSNTGSGHWW